MKQLLRLSAFLSLVVVGAIGCSGCGDDPVTPPTINPYVEYKQGDTFTYARYERDPANQRVESSKTMHKWIVLNADTTYAGKTKVTVIQQINYDMTGTTETSRERLYFRSQADGEVFQHNVLGSIVARFALAAQYADSIPKVWAKLTDTKSSNVQVWSSTGKQITPVTIPFVGEGLMQLEMMGHHRGKVATATPAGSYPASFHTDQTVLLTLINNATGSAMITDSLTVGYDVDVETGILRQAMKSDTVMVVIPIQGPTPQLVAGFEMELVSVKRAP